MRAAAGTLVRAAGLTVLLLAVAAVCRGQAAPTDTVAPATPPHGTVLFERHAADASQPATVETPPQETPQTAVGTSSSVRRRSTRRGLQHHDDPATAPATAATETPQVAPAAPCTAACDPETNGIAEADRRAAHIVQTVLDLHLNLQTGEAAAHATLQVRNGGEVPMARVPLQISSSLEWQGVHLPAQAGWTGAPLLLHQHRIVTDADHTGSATELAVVLPRLLLPGETVTLDLFYGGTLGSSAQRLLRLGAPADRAATADWDTVSDRFTGLRGFGNVLWLPAAAPTALLAAGTEFVSAVQAQKLLAADSRLRVRLTLETTGPAPGTAFLLGREQALLPVAAVSVAAPAPATASSSTSSEDQAVEGEARLYTAEWPLQPVGLSLPSLFVTAAPEDKGSGNVRVATENGPAADAMLAAADRVRPMLEEWLGPRPAQVLHVVDLPLEGAQPFAADSLLVAPLGVDAPKQLAPGLVLPMAQAWLPREVPAWFADGLPEFLRLLYAERTGARDAALATLRADRGLLAQAEAGTAMLPLRDCVDAVCARTKGAYVFAMLRQMAGDAALKQALAGWLGSRTTAQMRTAARPVSSSSDAPAASDAATGDTALFERLLQQSSGKDLQWFFTDWIDRDTGLPDLAIVQVAPRHIERGTVTNTVPAVRRPVGGPVGAEPVPQPGGPAEQESTTEASRNRLALPDGSWMIAVEVQNNGAAAAEVPVTVRGSGLQNTLFLRVPAHGRSTVRVPFETAPEEVTVNDGTVPEQRPGTHRRTITLPTNVR